MVCDDNTYEAAGKEVDCMIAVGSSHHMAHFWEMVVINEEIIAMLEKVHGVKSLEDPDVVVFGFDTTLTYEKLSNACHYIIKETGY